MLVELSSDMGYLVSVTHELPLSLPASPSSLPGVPSSKHEVTSRNDPLARRGALRAGRGREQLTVLRTRAHHRRILDIHETRTRNDVRGARAEATQSLAVGAHGLRPAGPHTGRVGNYIPASSSAG